VLSSGDFVPGGRILFGAGRPKQNMLNCFHKDTRIVTDDSIKKITDIEIGDRVLTHEGRYKTVVNKFSNGFKEKLLRSMGRNASGVRGMRLKKGDEIVVVFQYKLYENELRELCERYFENVELA